MSEQKIVITIDEQGGIHAKTSGFKGESCLDALEQLLDTEAQVISSKKTDEYHQTQQQSVQKKNTLKRK